jgi:hypothetical protein
VESGSGSARTDVVWLIETETGSARWALSSPARNFANTRLKMLAVRKPCTAEADEVMLSFGSVRSCPALSAVDGSPLDVIAPLSFEPVVLMPGHHGYRQELIGACVSEGVKPETWTPVDAGRFSLVEPLPSK